MENISFCNSIGQESTGHDAAVAVIAAAGTAAAAGHRGSCVIGAKGERAVRRAANAQAKDKMQIGPIS